MTTITGNCDSTLYVRCTGPLGLGSVAASSWFLYSVLYWYSCPHLQQENRKVGKKNSQKKRSEIFGDWHCNDQWSIGGYARGRAEQYGADTVMQKMGLIFLPITRLPSRIRIHIRIRIRIRINRVLVDGLVDRAAVDLFDHRHSVLRRQLPCQQARRH